jgi:hypothetical protein
MCVWVGLGGGDGMRVVDVELNIYSLVECECGCMFEVM